jgi:hypothetical protein
MKGVTREPVLPSLNCKTVFTDSEQKSEQIFKGKYGTQNIPLTQKTYHEKKQVTKPLLLVHHKR